jgi:hypothetical protein
MTTIQAELGFKPRCMATALSTVPFRDPEEACRIMLENFPEAPLCAQAEHVVATVY